MRTALLLSLIASAALASGANAATLPVEISDPARVSISSDREMCSAQAFLPWCSGGVQGSREFSLADVEAINRQYAGRVHYKRRTNLTWRSSFDSMPVSGLWRADCADLTLTTLDALSRAGFPTDRMWRMIVIPETRRNNPNEPSVLHMVGVVEIEGECWVVGDTNNLDRIYRLDQAEFVPSMVSKVSDGRYWTRTERKAIRA